MVKKIVSIVLTLCVLMSCVAVGTFSTQAATSSSGVDYGLVDNVQYGQILHCWNWSFNNIKNNLKRIAEQGFTAIQTSPIQTSKESTTEYYTTVANCWWTYYQPVGFNIETNTRNALGTKSEFEAMCAEAHKYGIRVIVDVVFNHLANDTSKYTVNQQVDGDLRNDGNCWHSPMNYEVSNFSNRYDVTHYSLSGLPDLNTGDSKVQWYAASFLKECIAAGADGFRFDAARHIETPSDAYGTGSNFWPNVLNEATSYAKSTRGITPYYYGEVLDTPASVGIGAYTAYMSVTDNYLSAVARNGILNKNASTLASSYTGNGAAQDKTVLWFESHDEYAADSNWTRTIDESIAKRAWGILGTRNQVSALYLARPSNFTTTMLGDADVTGWASDEVRAINQFKNYFAGQSEYLTSSGSIAYNERGNSGVVLVNANGGSTSVNVPANKIYNGTYTDVITGNKFTVSNGRITGSIGSSGIAVVYNKAPSASINYPSRAYRTSTLTLTLNCENAAYGRYSFDDYTYYEFQDGDTIKIGSGASYGTKTNVYIQAVNSEGVYSSLEKYTYTKMNPNTSFDVYFDNSNYGWPYTFAYVYNEGGAVAEWPGIQLEFDDNTNLNKFTVPVGYENGYVIFNNNESQQAPPAGNEGLRIPTETCIFTRDTLTPYTPYTTEGVSGDIYLKTSSWGDGGAILKGYAWTGGDSAMVKFSKITTGIYKATLPGTTKFKHIKILRLNPNGTGSTDWDNIWNQTQTVIPTGMNYFVMNDGEWDGAGGTWSVYSGSTEVEVTPVYLAGTMTSWNNTEMEETSDSNVVSLTMDLTAGRYSFKILDSSWLGSSSTFTDSVTNLSVVNTGDYCVLEATGGTYTFKYNKSTKKLTVTYVPAETQATTAATEATESSVVVGSKSSVSLAGSFNSWDKTATMMTYASSTVVTTTMNLDAGKYTFKIVDSWWYGKDTTINDSTSSAITLSNTAGNCTLQATGGTYTFKYNLNTHALTISFIAKETEAVVVGSKSDVSIAGSFNSWDKTANMMTYKSNDVVTTTMDLDAGTYKFKIVDTWWYGNTGIIEDTTTTTSSVGWELSSSAGDITLDASGGTYTFTYNRSTCMLTVTFVPAETESVVIGSKSTVALAGTFNGWDKTATMMTYASADTVEATLELSAGKYAFKVVDSWWFGSSDVITDTASNVALSSSGGNCTLDASGGTYTFTYNMSSHKITITFVAGATEPDTDVEVGSASKIALSGTFNEWVKNDYMNYKSNNVVTLTKTLAAGTYAFKIVDGLWYGNDGIIQDTTTATSSDGWELISTSGNTTLIASGGEYTFEYNIKTHMLTVTYVADSSSDSGSTVVVSPVSVAGSFNNWDKTATMMTVKSGNVVTTSVKLSAGTYKFKIVDAAAWYGNNGTIVNTTTATSSVGWEMSSSAGDCTLQASGGTYTFEYNRSTRMLKITYAK